MSITSSLAAKIYSTDGADDMFALSLELVDEVTLLVFKVEITFGTVVVQGFHFLVLSHLFDGGEEKSTVIVGAGDLFLWTWSIHLGPWLRGEGVPEGVGTGDEGG